jgi:hypothetical protein
MLDSLYNTTQEAEIRKIEVQSQAGKIVCPQYPILKIPNQKRAGGVVEFKL